MKSAIWIGMIVGSTAGAYVPLLWGDGLLSFSSVIFTAVGGIAGIYIAYKMVNW